MTRGLDERLVEDFASLDPVYADGVLAFLNLGETFASVYYRFVPVKSEAGIVTLQKIPTLAIVQPRSSLVCGKACGINLTLDAQGGLTTPVGDVLRSFN